LLRSLLIFCRAVAVAEVGRRNHGADGTAGGVKSYHADVLDVTDNRLKHIIPNKNVDDGHESARHDLGVRNHPGPNGNNHHFNDSNEKKNHRETGKLILEGSTFWTQKTPFSDAFCDFIMPLLKTLVKLKKTSSLLKLAKKPKPSVISLGKTKVFIPNHPLLTRAEKQQICYNLLRKIINSFLYGKNVQEPIDGRDGRSHWPIKKRRKKFHGKTGRSRL
jgi:hypothetical protein